MKKLEELPLLACFDAELLTNSSITQALEIYFPSESRCGRPENLLWETTKLFKNL